MFIVNLCGTDLELPLSDEEMLLLRRKRSSICSYAGKMQSASRRNTAE